MRTQRHNFNGKTEQMVKNNRNSIKSRRLVVVERKMATLFGVAQATVVSQES